ncbi:hypothetical protein MRX96_028314 [Rhipicephalus microplus]
MNPALRNPPATSGVCRNLQARNKKCEHRCPAPRTTSLHSLVLTRLVSRHFHPPTALLPNPEEVPIVSSGRYVLPETGHLNTDQCTSIEMQTAGVAPTDRRERSRSRSPLRGEDKSPGVPSSLPANLENKPRRSKAPVCSSDSDAPPIAKSPKLDALPTRERALALKRKQKR